MNPYNNPSYPFGSSNPQFPPPISSLPRAPVPMPAPAAAALAAKGFNPAYFAPPQFTAPSPTVVVPGEKLTTLFVGGIPEGISDEFMERLLRTCGTLNKWQRVRDPQGNPKGFGFCEYAEPDHVLNALRILGVQTQPAGPTGEVKETGGVELPCKDGTMKRLKINADEKTRLFLAHYQIQNPTPLEEWKLREERIKAVLQDVLSTAPVPLRSASRGGRAADSGRKSSHSPPPPPPPPPLGGRDRGGDRGGDYNKYRPDDYSTGGGGRSRNSNQPPSRGGGGGGGAERRGFRPTGTENLNRRNFRVNEQFALEYEHPDDDDILEEQKRRESASERRRRNYEEQLRRWEQKEQQRLAMDMRDAQVEEERKARRERERQEWAKRLEEWDDSKEEEEAKVEYYQDRRAWRLKRQEVRRMEMEQDERDRRREEHAQEKGEESMSPKASAEAGSSSRMSHNHMEVVSTTVMMPPPPKNLNNVLGKGSEGMVKRREFAEEEEDEEEEQQEQEQLEQPKKKKRALVPIVYNDTETFSKEREEEMKERIKVLVNEIPVELEDLKRWPVQWQELNEVTFSYFRVILIGREQAVVTKLQSFTGKKIMEILGVPEPELVKFVIEHLKKRRGPRELVKELEMTLDVEADKLVTRLWRMLIFETESKARKLTL